MSTKKGLQIHIQQINADVPVSKKGLESKFMNAKINELKQTMSQNIKAYKAPQIINTNITNITNITTNYTTLCNEIVDIFMDMHHNLTKTVNFEYFSLTIFKGVQIKFTKKLNINYEDKAELMNIKPSKMLKKINDITEQIFEINMQLQEQQNQGNPYEKLLQKSEQDVRNHIRCQNQLKVLLESAHFTMEENAMSFKRMQDDYQAQIKKLKINNEKDINKLTKQIKLSQLKCTDQAKNLKEVQLQLKRLQNSKKDVKDRKSAYLNKYNNKRKRQLSNNSKHDTPTQAFYLSVASNSNKSNSSAHKKSRQLNSVDILSQFRKTTKRDKKERIHYTASVHKYGRNKSKPKQKSSRLSKDRHKKSGYIGLNHKKKKMVKSKIIDNKERNMKSSLGSMKQSKTLFKINKNKKSQERLKSGSSVTSGILVHQNKRKGSKDRKNQVKIRHNSRVKRHHKSNYNAIDKKHFDNYNNSKSSITKSINFELESYKKQLRKFNSKIKNERSVTQMKSKKRHQTLQHQTLYNLSLKLQQNKEKHEKGKTFNKHKLQSSRLRNRPTKKNGLSKGRKQSHPSNFEHNSTSFTNEKKKINRAKSMSKMNQLIRR